MWQMPTNITGLTRSNGEGIPLPSVMGKGLCGVRHSIPWPLPSKPLLMFPHGFPNPCSSLGICKACEHIWRLRIDHVISDVGMQKLCRMPAKEVHHFREMPWHTISVGLACKHNDNSLSIKLCFACPWACLYTSWRPEHAPQNHLQNGGAVLEVSELLFSYFLPYAHHLLSHLIWSVLHDLGLVWIPSCFVKMLHKTVYETVKPLWR